MEKIEKMLREYFSWSESHRDLAGKVGVTCNDLGGGGESPSNWSNTREIHVAGLTIRQNMGSRGGWSYEDYLLEGLLLGDIPDPEKAEVLKELVRLFDPLRREIAAENQRQEAIQEVYKASASLRKMTDSERVRREAVALVARLRKQQ